MRRAAGGGQQGAFPQHRRPRLPSKAGAEVTVALCGLFGQLPPSARLSLTLDNGKAFARHEELASVAGIDVFFASPYHSWERGTNAYTNGLIRRLHPKQSSCAEIGEEELKRIEMVPARVD